MIKLINISFFGGGSSSTTTQVQKRDPKSSQLTAMDQNIFKLLNPLSDRYGNESYVSGNSQLEKNLDVADALAAQAGRNSSNLLDTIPGYLGQSNSALQQAQGIASGYVNPYQKDEYGKYIDKMGESVDQTDERTSKYYDDADWYLQQNKDLSSRGTSEGLENYMAEIYKSINSNFGKSAATMINDAAGRGVINSSISQRGIKGLSDSASSAAGAQYSDGFKTLLGNSLQGAQTSGGLAESTTRTGNQTTDNYQKVINSMLGANASELQTMQGQTGALGNIAQGYNRDYTSGLQGLDAFAKMPAQYYQSAVAPVTPLYNYWKDMQDAYYGHEDYDTVVSSGGK